MEENKVLEEVMESVTSEPLDVSFEELPAEPESKGKLNVGTVLLTAVGVGGAVYLGTKAVKKVGGTIKNHFEKKKEEKLRKAGWIKVEEESENDLELEDEEIAEELEQESSEESKQEETK